MNQSGLNIVYPFGTKAVTVLAGDSISVYAQGRCSVLQAVGAPNVPSSPSLIGTVNNGETVFGPFTNGAVITLNSNSGTPVLYETGLAPRVLENAASQTQGAPGVLNATGTLTGAMILSGIVTTTSGAAVAATLDTGTVMDTQCRGMQIGQSFDWAVVNTGGNAFTVTASAGHTIVGNAVVATVSSARFRTRKTAAATYITYAVPTPIS